MDLPSLESSIQLSPGALLGWQGDISYLGFPAWTSRSLSPSPNPVTFQASFYLVEYSVISTPLDMVKQSSNLHGCTLRTFPGPCPLPSQLRGAVAPVRTPSCSHLTYGFSHKTIPGVPLPRLWEGGVPASLWAEASVLPSGPWWPHPSPFALGAHPTSCPPQASALPCLSNFLRGFLPLLPQHLAGLSPGPEGFVGRWLNMAARPRCVG